LFFLPWVQAIGDGKYPNKWRIKLYLLSCRLCCAICLYMLKKMNKNGDKRNDYGEGATITNFNASSYFRLD
jgi:phage gp36-like protein